MREVVALKSPKKSSGMINLFIKIFISFKCPKTNSRLSNKLLSIVLCPSWRKSSMFKIKNPVDRTASPQVFPSLSKYLQLSTKYQIPVVFLSITSTPNAWGGFLFIKISLFDASYYPNVFNLICYLTSQQSHLG